MDTEMRKTMTITIALSPETERQLVGLAAENGQDVAGYVHQLIEKEVRAAKRPPGTPPASAPANETFDQTFAPFAQMVERRGMTDDELDTLFRQARGEVWQEKQAQ
jgi:hypothetical protein